MLSYEQLKHTLSFLSNMQTFKKGTTLAVATQLDCFYLCIEVMFVILTLLIFCV